MIKEQKIKFLKSEFQRFVKYFNLLDYEYFYEESDDVNMRCSVKWWPYNDKFNADARSISFGWSKAWIESKITKYEISKCAFHEVIEVLLLPLRELAESREIVVTERKVKLENHRIIRILENTIFEKLS